MSSHWEEAETGCPNHSTDRDCHGRCKRRCLVQPAYPSGDGKQRAREDCGLWNRRDPPQEPESLPLIESYGRRCVQKRRAWQPEARLEALVQCSQALETDCPSEGPQHG